MRLLVPPLVALCLIYFAASIATGSRARRDFAVLVALSSVLHPWFLPRDLPLLRGCAALVAFVGTMRVIDLRRGEWTLRDRMLHIASVVDTRRLVKATPTFHGRGVAVGLAWLVVAFAGFGGLEAMSSASAGPFWLARWGATLVVYGGVSAGYALIEVAYAALGFTTPSLHNAPLSSRTVQELWGERWAKPVSLWLGETFFRPFARRRRPATGALAAFTVSAGFHAYGVWVALGVVTGLPMTAWMFAFFVAQALVMAVERRLGVKKWAPWAGHLWTVTLMLATAPMFLEPTARILGMEPR